MAITKENIIRDALQRCFDGDPFAGQHEDALMLPGNHPDGSPAPSTSVLCTCNIKEKNAAGRPGGDREGEPYTYKSHAPHAVTNDVYERGYIYDLKIDRGSAVKILVGNVAKGNETLLDEIREKTLGVDGVTGCTVTVATTPAYDGDTMWRHQRIVTEGKENPQLLGGL